MNVTFHGEALEEYLAAVAWYERDYPGRGERFSVALEQVLAAIAEAPQTFPNRLGAYTVTLHRFPYVVFYEVVDAETLRVLAVAHARRRPGYWNKRR